VQLGTRNTDSNGDFVLTFSSDLYFPLFDDNDAIELNTSFPVEIFIIDPQTGIGQANFFRMPSPSGPRTYDMSTTLSSCPGDATPVKVVDERGHLVNGAEVYVNGDLYPKLTSNGYVAITPRLRAGDKLFARLRIKEDATGLGDHDVGSTQNWRYRVYITSLGLTHDLVGTSVNLAQHVITDPFTAQTLRLDRRKTQIGLHLVASIEWDTSDTEFSASKNRIRSASQYLYNATDGQFLIEQVELFDDKQGWYNADYRIYADWSLRANVDAPRGVFLGDSEWYDDDSQMHMSRKNGHDVYAHEFGHYGFDLADEYKDDHPEVHCTAAVTDAGPDLVLCDNPKTPGIDESADDGPFSACQERAACMMWHQWSAPKLCSNHPANPHAFGTKQGNQDCWSHIAERYRDSEGLQQGAERWLLVTPPSRGLILGKLPDMPVGLQTKFGLAANRTYPERLCSPMNVRTFVFEAIRNDIPVYTRRAASSRWIKQGKTYEYVDDYGNTHWLAMAGVHVGDTAKWVYNAGPYSTYQKSHTITVAECDAADVIFAPGGPPPVPPVAATLDPEPFTLQSRIMGSGGSLKVEVAPSVALRAAPAAVFQQSDNDAQTVLPVQYDWVRRGYTVSLAGLAAGVRGLLVVEGLNNDGESSSRFVEVAVQASGGAQPTEAFSSDGVIELTLPGHAVPPNARIVVASGLDWPAALKPGERLLAGPYQLSSSAGDLLNVAAMLEFRLPEESAAAVFGALDVHRIEIMRYDETSGRWQTELAKISPEVETAMAKINRLGTFVLVARRTDIAGDCDRNGRVGLPDLASLVGCMGQLDETPDSEVCRCADFDGDGDVDLQDLSLLQATFAGD